MANSSPFRRTSKGPTSSPVIYTSPARPERPELSDFLTNARNSPEAHKRGLESAKKEHERVLQAALHVYELHQLAEETRRIEQEELQRQERAKAEQKRIEDARRAEARRLEDEARIAALKAKPIPKPALSPPSAEAPPDASQTPEKTNGVSTQETPPQRPTTNGSMALKPLLNPPDGTRGFPASALAKTSLSSEHNKIVPEPVSVLQNPQQGSSSQAGVGSSSLARAAAPTPPPQQAVDRHILVHKKLKELRAFMLQQAKSNPTLKSEMGDMRRTIRKCIGQLTSGGLKENRVPSNKITATLKDAMNIQKIPSALIDPGEFTLEPKEPVQGAAYNDQLPSLFLYLMNILAKAVISQFINESGADTRTADSIGQVAVKVFSDEEFLWRGKPLIDILVAKYRVVCPVLFGFRGNDKMEHARLRVGWKKDASGGWISEQEHGDRMTGLGAGFAALTLRDFSKAKRQNPWPPTAYWAAFARIINTPPQEISKTQCIVLKAMIANYEQKFIGMYGSAAVAAMRVALIEFPAKVPEKSSASQALTVQAKSLAVSTGLRLGPVS